VEADEEPEGAAAPEPVVTADDVADVDDAGVEDAGAVEPEAAGADADEVAVLLAERVRVVCALDAECDLAVCAWLFAPDAAVFGDGELPPFRTSTRATATHTAAGARPARIQRRGPVSCAA
jgi:hypothetical protein